MLGSLRFILALAVAFSHMGLTPDFHFGAAALVVFYMIAGYVMTHSFTANFGADPRAIGSFYVDRLFRIYPLYALSLAMVVLLVMATGYGKLYLDPASLFVNATLLSANTYPTLINPPTWSLATEAQFYLLLPLLLLVPRLQLLLLPLSYAVFLAASFGTIPPVEWAYKYLPGTLWIFLTGSLIYRQQRGDTGVPRRLNAGLALVLVLHLVVLAGSRADVDQPYAFESLCGVLFGIGCLLLCGRARTDNRALDDWLGKLSYPLFLSHVCVLYLFDHLRVIGVLDPGPRGATALQMLVAVALSLPLALLDDRIQLARKRFQQRHVKTTAPARAAANA